MKNHSPVNLRILHTFAGLVLVVLSTGCASFIPKPVEYFQQEVKAVPEYSTKDNETLRQTAKLAAVKAAETERAALATASAPEVISPAQDTVKLTDAVSDRLGVPEKAWTGDIAILLKRMDAQNARYQTALDTYRTEVRELAGKKVEGTGLFQIGYFTHIALYLA